MNILFLLTPKSDCAYVREEDTIRQALERMSAAGFAAVPILAKDGTYRGTLTEGDLLWAIKKLYLMDMKEAESHASWRSSGGRTTRRCLSPPRWRIC